MLLNAFNARCVAAYMRFVALTSSVSTCGFKEMEKGRAMPGLFLFWHEDAYTIMLLKSLFKESPFVVVADTNRKAYWKEVLDRLGINMLFSHSSLWIRHVAKRKAVCFMAYDGPFGPAKQRNKQVDAAIARLGIPAVVVDCEYRIKVKTGSSLLPSVLPLPFGRIRFRFTPVNEIEHNTDQ